MCKNIILCCILPVNVGVPFIGQHETTEISEILFHDKALTAVSKFYW